ncbi:MAG: class I SAM-dependent methyltransferase [Candidatus Omnitrophica bacterium]|nr:class I SAM-dependent methyltransferase [Candidatus Omnitrophota bacterium]
MIHNIYNWFHQKISRPGEEGEYSKGYWPDRIRREAIGMCRGLHGRLLEVGCGEGLFMAHLAQENPALEIWGIDNNRDRLTEVDARIKRQGLGNVRALLGQASRLDLQDDYFDAVVCVNVFINMPSFEMVEQALNEMGRVCKKGGVIIFEFRNALNPLLKIKYGLARYYDETVKGLPLMAYHAKEIEKVLSDMRFEVTGRRHIGFPLGILAPVIVIEAKKS